MGCAAWENSNITRIIVIVIVEGLCKNPVSIGIKREDLNVSLRAPPGRLPLIIFFKNVAYGSARSSEFLLELW